MNKKLIYKLLIVITIVLIIAFIFFVVADLKKYTEFMSAPFHTYIIVRFLEFILPAIVSFIAAIILRKKNK